VYNTLQFCTEAYTNPAHVQMESGFVIYVYNTRVFRELTQPQHIGM